MEKFFIPPYVEAVINKIEYNGYEAWLVGGCVRDMLSGITPHDYDIASNAPCEAISSMFDRVIETGIRHGTVTVISDGQPIEVTRYRIDGDYADHRRPDSVNFTCEFKNDLARRDFTVNAIGYNEKRGIFDCFGGKEDIERKILRTVGDAKRRFDEDALRILRAIRFASTLGYTIENGTLTAIKSLSKTLHNVSAERIYSEVKKVLMGKAPSLIEIIIKNGGFEHLGIDDCDDLSPLDRVDENLNVRIAILLKLCRCNPSSVLSKLKAERITRTTVGLIYTALDENQPFDRCELKRLLQKHSAEDIFAILSAHKVLYGHEILAAKDELRDIVEKNEPYLIRHLTIGGDDLAKMGISGEAVGRVLNDLLERAIIDPELNSPEKLKSIINSN
ncbi:MAG: CCA tRNA nucleotidyltransferase [Clostridia bacterium]|nr:CCA tRNA nucleotidyltransferase [Clostridia bacterium]